MKNFIAATAMLTVASCATAETLTMNVKGTVTDVQPLTRVVSVERPHRSCNTVEVPVYGNVGGGASAGDVLGGMIIGGLLGKGVSGNDKGAAAGAVLGGMISADKKTQQGIVGYRQEQRCTTEYITELQERSAGYRVTIEVDGNTFETVTNRKHRVGQRVEVRKQYSF
jgi:uncharacterized protein YcfJ